VEKIRQALDRARAERYGAAGAPPARSRPEVSVRVVSAAGPEPAPAAETLPARPAERFDVGPLVLDRGRLVVPRAGAPAARAFRMLRTQVLQRMREHGWRTCGVVSARSGDGKTTVALNLALAIAAGPEDHALVVDLDLIRPGVAPAFGLAPERGVEDVLAGTRDVDACLYRPVSFPRLALLPVRSRVEGSSELVAGARLGGLVTEVRDRYPDRTVLFDLPPVLETDDASSIAPWLDCLLLVVAEGASARADVVRALELLGRRPVLGTVLNRSTEPLASDAYAV
jgi:Mrp family chromosome partitioning ATPase